jgi:hypothetical protein
MLQCPQCDTPLHADECTCGFLLRQPFTRRKPEEPLTTKWKHPRETVYHPKGGDPLLDRLE